ncbi:DUF5954 family protein [Streptomyces halobius]|uniref:DUF5954 family protein n=1 Tax=Streptomyces halobius TaxID=2879846 RepID=A0ABY4M6T7_9ACTN|nr:DUF5954 family protein [Streptomyces halobius]UQA93489.1 DUF5954 family protein [Streptomyces halobius]
MSHYSEQVPAYRTIRVVAQDSPVAAFSDEEAWRARDAYPEILAAGGAVFGHVREREEGGWEVVSFGESAPQDSRDTMASTFRRLAQQAEKSGDEVGRAECMAAAVRLGWEKLDELTVLGDRYRVVHGEQFIRKGPDGPEPPRPSDPDPAEPGEAHRMPSRTTGFVIDPVVGTGMSEGILKLDLLQFVRAAGTVPPDVRRDSRRAKQTHPGGVLLPPGFMIAERVGDGRWKPHSAACSTPQAARDALTMWLRVMAPVTLQLDQAERDAYERAANLLDERPGNEIEVADGAHFFKVVRVERLVRVGPDGPEGPRPSDFDPDPPVEAHTQQLREQGLWREEDEVNEGLVLEEMRDVARLVEKEQARREWKRQGEEGAP